MNRSANLLLVIIICFACTRQNKDQNSVTNPVRDPGSKSKISRTSPLPPSLSSDVHPGKGFRSHKNKRNGPFLLPDQGIQTFSMNRDSAVVSLPRILREKDAELDLNEPTNRAILSSTIAPADFPGMILLSRERFLKISFDNDIFDYTDRFYTNGVRIDLIHPSLSENPVTRISVPYWGHGMNYYGISLVQNLYTPSTTKIGGIQYGDRPFAAYLYLASFKITNDPQKRFRMTSEIDLGIIGPYSLGEYMQKSFHNALPSNSEPEGWEYQVQNDLVLNYSVTFDKGVINEPWMNVNLISTAILGTLCTNISGGVLARAGWMNPYFANLGISKRSRLSQNHLRQFQGYFFVKGSTKLVGYDATLQGGLLNRTSPYTLTGADVSRLVFQSSLGLAISFGGFEIEAEQFLLSPEFTGGSWHKWGHIGLTFCF